MNNKKTLALISFASLAGASHAASLWTYSLVGGYNFGVPGIVEFASQGGNGPQTIANGSHTFTGLDSSNNSQTMDVMGQTINSANYGRLHTYTELSATNIYHNVNNPKYHNTDGSVNEAGSADGVTSLGFSGFNDTLHYGGALAIGYRARYVFHVDGTNTGPGCLADMAFQIQGYDAESFFSFGAGYNSEIWATQTYDINGITPQEVNVQFSNQVVFDFPNYTEGSNLHGISNYSSTLTLDHIEVVDATGSIVSGVSVTSDSGTQYTVVPEPASLLALAGGIVFILRRKR